MGEYLSLLVPLMLLYFKLFILFFQILRQCLVLAITDSQGEKSTNHFFPLVEVVALQTLEQVREDKEVLVDLVLAVEVVVLVVLVLLVAVERGAMVWSSFILGNAINAW